jgi:hypothetical protein
MDLLDGLHERLMAAADTAAASGASGPFTIADVYQRLIPHRAVRGTAGMLELAEYEHALLRLLSGERHYLEVSDPAVKLEIQRELASLNPILGIYRDYSTAAVRLLRDASPATESPGHPAEPVVASSPPTATPVPALAIAVQVPLAEGPVESEATGPRPSSDPTAPRSPGEVCPDCGRSLPVLDEIQFCPYCGATLTPKPCGHCGAAMEREWSFCVRCGTHRSAGAR